MARILLVVMLTVSPVAIAALSLGAYLAFGSIRIDYLETVGSRFQAVGDGLAADAEAALAVGLPLAGQETLERLIDRARAADPMIATIDVLTGEGRVLFSTDPSRVGETVAFGLGADQRAVERHSVIRNAYEGVEGRILLTGAPGPIGAALARLAADVRFWTILSTTLVIVLSAIACAAILAIAQRTLARDEEGGDGDPLPREARAAIAEVDRFHAEMRARLAGAAADVAGS